MTKIDDLLAAYQKQISLPWNDLLSPQEKVWFCIYDPSQERRLRKQMEAFAIVTQETGHDWIPIDVTFLFEQFLASNEHHEKYYRNPRLINSKRRTSLSISQTTLGAEPNRALHRLLLRSAALGHCMASYVSARSLRRS
jgi:hypothetical protein